MNNPRPLFETRFDQIAERRILDKLKKTWGIEARKLPIKYGLDYMIWANNDRRAFIEIKHRDMAWGDYPTIMLSLHKVLKARELHLITGFPSLFVVEDNNGSTRYCNFAKIPQNASIEFGGRTAKTRDADDIEPVYMIPIKLFQPI